MEGPEPTQPDPAAAAPATDLSGVPKLVDQLVREYFMFIVVGVLVVWLLWSRVRNKLEDVKSQATHRSAKITDEDRLERMLAARERQQQYVTEATKRDAEEREAKRKRELEEREAKLAAAKAKAADPGTGRTLGGGDGAAPQPPAPGGTLPRGEFMARLPRLSGGEGYERDTTRPSYTPGGGGGYRPSGFRPPPGGGGG